MREERIKMLMNIDPITLHALQGDKARIEALYKREVLKNLHRVNKSSLAMSLLCVT